MSLKHQKAILLDTGPLVGLYSQKDDWHLRCAKFFSATTDYDYVITHAVVVEVVYHLQRSNRPMAAARVVVSFLQDIENRLYQIHELTGNYIGRMKELHERYTDKKLDFADLSLVIAAEDKQISKIVTLDFKDFSFLTFKTRQHQACPLKGFSVIVPGQS